MFLNFLKEKHFVHQRLVNLKKKYDYSKNNSQLQENQTWPIVYDFIVGKNPGRMM